MRTKIPILLLFLLTIPLTTEAKFSRYVGVGLNRSSFRTEESKSLIGASVELGLDYYPVKSFGGFIGSGLIYQNKRIFMDNRTYPSSFDPKDSEDVITTEIKVNIRYFEIPLYIGYSIKIQENSILSIFSGYTLSIPIADHTDWNIKNIRKLTSDEKGNYNFDYFSVDESGIGLLNNYFLGFRTTYNQFGLLISYLKALTPTSNISGMSISDKIDCFKLSIVYQF